MLNTRGRRRLSVALGFAVLGSAVTFGGCKSEEEKQKEKMAEAAQKVAEGMKELAAAGKEEAAEKVAAAAESVKEATNEGVDVAAKNMAQAAQKMAAAMAKAGKAVGELVNFRELKKLLPESIGNFTRKSASGEKAGAMGMGVAKAEGKYADKDGNRLDIEIIDTAGMAAMMAFGLGAVEIDKETEDGYEKTTTIGEHKALEKYNSKTKRGDLKILVANRFIVEIEGRGVDMDTIKAARKAVDLDALAALKPNAEE